MDVSKPMRVCSPYAQDQIADHAQVGQHIALNIADDAQKEKLNHGDRLLSDAPPKTFARVIASLEHAAPLMQWQPLYVHRVAGRVTEHISLPKGTLTELVFDTPLQLTDNDRLVLYDISTHMMLADTHMVTLSPPCREKRKPEYLQWLSALKSAQTDDDALTLHLTRGAVNIPGFTWARQLDDSGMRPLVEQHGFTRAGYSLLNAPIATRWQRKVLGALAICHEQHRDEPRPGREHLRHMALPMKNETLVLLLIERMRESDAIHSHHSWLHLPEHKAGFNDEQLVTWREVEPLFGDEPRWVRDLTKQTGTGEQVIRVTLRQAMRQGVITAIVEDRYYCNNRIVAFTNMIHKLDRERGSTCVADFHD